MNVDRQVICCTITSVLSGTVAVGKVVSDKKEDRFWGTRKLTDIES